MLAYIVLGKVICLPRFGELECESNLSRLLDTRQRMWIEYCTSNLRISITRVIFSL